MSTITGLDDDQAESVRDLLMAGRRVHRDALREFLYRYSSLPRVAKCGATIVDERGVGVVVKDRVAHFRGLGTCASVHACPSCGAKIRNRRAEEVSALMAAHLEDGHGRGALFVTLTMRHDRGHRLDDLYRIMQTAWDALGKNRAGRELRQRYGITGFVRAVETTYGGHGWHPHLHVLFLTDRTLTTRARRALAGELHELWNGYLTAQGVGELVRGVGVDVRSASRGAVGSYMVGVELARSDLKRGREGGQSPMQILSAAADDGDADALRVWHEYETASRGRRALTWSRGLKATYGIGVQTEEEIAAEEVGGELVAIIEQPLWSQVVRLRGMRGRIKRAAETDGANGVQELLARIEGDRYPGGTIGARLHVPGDPADRARTFAGAAARVIARRVLLRT